ncbi:MAG: hypothetical protein SGPRY_007057 [Prymnesium sp.]
MGPLVAAVGFLLCLGGEAVYDEPEEEPSRLLTRERSTHDDRGEQFNFVSSQLHQPTEGVRSPSVKELLESLSQLQALVKPKAAALPPVPPDSPTSEVLRAIRLSLHQLHTPDMLKPAAEGEAVASEEDGSIDRLSDERLEMLEGELLAKLQRVRATRRSRKGVSSAESFDTQLSHETPSLTDLLSRAFGDHDSRRPGGVQGARLLQSRRIEREEDDDIESYAARLAAEARQRGHGSSPSEESTLGTGGGMRGAGSGRLQEVIQQLLGGEGDVVEVKVILRDEANDAMAAISEAVDDGATEDNGGTLTSRWATMLDTFTSSFDETGSDPRDEDDDADDSDI